MNLSHIFEKVIVLHLERRTERLAHFLSNLPSDWPFQVPVVYPAVDGKMVTPPSWWKSGRGAWGCYRSHLHILENCLNEKIESVLIFEDDAVCVDEFTRKTQRFFEHLPDDWEMIYLGGEHLMTGFRLPRKINEWVYRPFNVNRCHGYGLRGRKIIEKIYHHLCEYDSWTVPHHVDHRIGELHRNIPTGLYVPHQWLVTQSEGKSDIASQWLNKRHFTGAEELVYPRIDCSCVVLTGQNRKDLHYIAGILWHLGLFFGKNLTSSVFAPNSPAFEEMCLSKICQLAFDEKSHKEKMQKIDRINHLRHWLGIQCQIAHAKNTIIAGCHPLLTLMLEEIVTAWNNPKIIYVMSKIDEYNPENQRSKDESESHKHKGSSLFMTSTDKLQLITRDMLFHDTSAVIASLCDFLNYDPKPQQYHYAMNYIRVSVHGV